MMAFEVGLDGLEDVANAIAEKIAHKRIACFEGSMGAGKTTLIKAVAKALGISEEVSSPTFSIVNEYESPKGLVYHFDFYRIEEEEEALDFGVEEYFYSGRPCLIEWSEKIVGLLPEQEDCFFINIELAGTNRKYAF